METGMSSSMLCCLSFEYENGEIIFWEGVAYLPREFEILVLLDDT
jgi:hypothetical protein